MQIVYLGDGLHEMSNLILGGKNKKNFKTSSAEILTPHAEH